MSASTVRVELPADVAEFRLPQALQHRLQFLLDRQDEGLPLTNEERQEAEGLVELAEWISLVKISSETGSSKPSIRK